MSKKCCNVKVTEKTAKELLVKHGVNRTKTKINTLLVLSKSKTPLSANEIHENIGANTCDISTIFRTLTQFKDKNIVSEINLGESFFRYELNSIDGGDHHHHHVRCRECGDIKLLDKCDLSKFEKAMGKLGFKNLEHSLEFTGICSNCN